MPEPLPLELYFAANRPFQRIWEGSVCDMADRVLAYQLAREKEGAPRATLVTEIPETVPEDDINTFNLRYDAPWPSAVLASPETVQVTFSHYVLREVQRRLDLRAAE